MTTLFFGRWRTIRSLGVPAFLGKFRHELSPASRRRRDIREILCFMMIEKRKGALHDDNAPWDSYVIDLKSPSEGGDDVTRLQVLLLRHSLALIHWEGRVEVIFVVLEHVSQVTIESLTLIT